MPQTTIEYSNNLVEKEALDPKILPVEINKVLAAMGQFGEGDLKCVAHSNSIYARSPQPEGKAFLWVVVSILAGRPLEFRQKISTDIVTMLKSKIKLVDGLEIQISVDVHEMAKETYIKEIL